ncbi:unnamed protein product [Nesidiocoris tenuis]|uniref:Uncharacterized protein n=1 Tax=Nesidiocoris tenuis TaxID=355587 RepID=A0A6H5H1V8_9HEMI|nr:unnamed protein product [Nesidiocoris tenuis]
MLPVTDPCNSSITSSSVKSRLETFPWKYQVFITFTLLRLLRRDRSWRRRSLSGRYRRGSVVTRADSSVASFRHSIHTDTRFDQLGSVFATFSLRSITRGLKMFLSLFFFVRLKNQKTSKYPIRHMVSLYLVVGASSCDAVELSEAFLPRFTGLGGAAGHSTTVGSSGLRFEGILE